MLCLAVIPFSPYLHASDKDNLFVVAEKVCVCCMVLQIRLEMPRKFFFQHRKKAEKDKRLKHQKTDYV